MRPAPRSKASCPARPLPHAMLAACCRRLGFGLAVASVTVVVASGCERTQAGESAELRAAQEAVLAASNAAPGEGQTTLEARLEGLEAAASRLEPLTGSENPRRRAIALETLAGIQLAKAQALGLQGRAASAQLRSDLGRLLAEVDSAERDAARAEAQRLDPAPAVATVESAKAESAARLDAIRTADERFTSEQAEVEKELEAAKAERLAAAAREAEQVDAAFLEAGDARYAALDAAAKARATADAAAAREREAEIRLEQVRRERALAEVRSDLARRGVERMDAAGRGFTEAGTAAAAAVTEARQAATGAAGEVAAAARGLHDRFGEQVLARMDEASQAAASASGRLDAAGADPLVMAESRMTEADLRAAAAVAAESFASGLGGVAARLQPLDASAGASLAELAETLKQTASQRRAAAAETLSAARAALEAAPADAPATASLNAVGTRLQTLLAAG